MLSGLEKGNLLDRRCLAGIIRGSEPSITTITHSFYCAGTNVGSFVFESITDA
jgi:hypothetical protein